MKFTAIVTLFFVTFFFTLQAFGQDSIKYSLVLKKEALSKPSEQDSLTRRQIKQDRVINRKLNRRYGTERITYYVQIDSSKAFVFPGKSGVLTRDVVLSKNQFDSLMKLVSRNLERLKIFMDSLALFKSMFSSVSTKYDDLQERFQRFREPAVEKIENFELRHLSDSTLINELQKEKDAKEGKLRILTNAIDTLQDNLQNLTTTNNQLKAQVNRLKQMLFDDSLSHFNQTIFDSLVKVRDSLQRSDERKSERIKELNRLLSSRNVWLSLTGFCLVGLLGFIFLFSLLKRRRLKFYPCFILDIKEDVIFADVYDQKTNTSELRKFEADPLIAIFEKECFPGCNFKLFVDTKPGKKEYIYKRGDKKIEKLFEDHYNNMREEYDRQNSKDKRDNSQNT